VLAAVDHVEGRHGQHLSRRGEGRRTGAAQIRAPDARWPTGPSRLLAMAHCGLQSTRAGLWAASAASAAFDCVR
jgi:hypothetical protein